MRANAAGLGKTECVAIRNQDGLPEHARSHGLAIYHGPGQLPGSRKRFVVLLGGRVKV
jgi:hypothetical protein